MNLLRCGHVILLLCVALTFVAVDGRRCRKESGKCRKRRLGKQKGAKGEKKPVAPRWKKGPPKDANHALRAGTNVSLRCTVRGFPTPVLSWLRDGRALTVTKKSKKYRQRKTRLTIKDLEVADSGQYTCIAKNKLGALNFTYNLHVLETMPLKDIEVASAPANQTAHPGDTVIFRCLSDDYPKPRIVWTRKTDRSNVMEVMTTSSGTQEELILHNVTQADSGLYTCAIGNGIIVKDMFARLDVIGENEQLPFEPPCSLHIRHDYIVDHNTGCRSSRPVEMYYCMGSCGRSYYVPQVVTTDAPNMVTDSAVHLNQTCQCCIGKVGALTVLEMDCPLGTKKPAFYQKLRDCSCQDCSGGKP